MVDDDFRTSNDVGMNDVLVDDTAIKIQQEYRRQMERDKKICNKKMPTKQTIDMRTVADPGNHADYKEFYPAHYNFENTYAFYERESAQWKAEEYKK